LDEWSGEDVEELFELLETQLGEYGIDLKTEHKADEEEDEDEDEDEEPVADDLEDDYFED
jgi:hypothetical protein